MRGLVPQAVVEMIGISPAWALLPIGAKVKDEHRGVGVITEILPDGQGVEFVDDRTRMRTNDCSNSTPRWLSPCSHSGHSSK